MYDLYDVCKYSFKCRVPGCKDCVRTEMNCSLKFLLKVNSRITELVGDLADRDRRRENEQREQARNGIKTLHCYYVKIIIKKNEKFILCISFFLNTTHQLGANLRILLGSEG